MSRPTRCISTLLLALLLVFPACSSPGGNLTPPSNPQQDTGLVVSDPTATSSPVPTVTVPPLPTPTPVFQISGIITSASIAGLKELARLGIGNYSAHEWSPDSQFAALATGAGIFVLSASDGSLLFNDFIGNVTGVAFSPDGLSLAVTTGQQVVIYNLPSGERQLSLDLDFIANDLAYAPQPAADLILVGVTQDNFGNTLSHIIARVKNGVVSDRREKANSHSTGDYEIASDASALLSYDYGRDQYIFHNLNGQSMGTISKVKFSHMAEVFSSGIFAYCDFDFENNMKATPVMVYRTGGQLLTRVDTGAKLISYLGVSPDGKILTMVADREIRRYSLPQGTLLEAVDYRGYGDPSPDLNRTFDGSQMRDRATNETLGDAIPVARALGTAIAISPDHTLMVVGYESSYDLEGDYQDFWGTVIDTRSLSTLRQDVFIPDRSGSPANELFTILNDNKTLAFHMEEDPLVYFWDITTGEQVGVLKLGIPALVAGVSDDGRYILAADDNGNVELWDRIANTLLGKKENVYQYAGYYSAVFSHDGKTAAVGGSDTLLIWAVGDKVEVREDRSNGPLAISPDGSWLAQRMGNASEVALYELSARRFASSWAYSGPVESLVFDSEGKMLLMDTVFSITFVDAATGAVLYNLPYDTRDYSLSADGFLLATTGQDGTVRLWGLP